MDPFQLAGWVGTAIVLGGYAHSVQTGKLRVFNVANVFGAVLLAASNISVGAWPGLAITVSFGLIGLYGLGQGVTDDDADASSARCRTQKEGPSHA